MFTLVFLLVFCSVSRSLAIDCEQLPLIPISVGKSSHVEGKPSDHFNTLYEALDRARWISRLEGARVQLRLGNERFTLHSPLLLNESDNCLTLSGTGLSVLQIAHPTQPAVTLLNTKFVTIEGVHVRVSPEYVHRRASPPAVCHIWVGPGQYIFHLVGGSNNTVRNCRIHGGLYGEGGYGHTVTRSAITNSWGGCMGFFSAGDSRTLTPCNHSFTELDVYNCTNADGIGLGDVTGVLVAHNDVHDVGCAAVRLNGVPDPYRYATGYPARGHKTPFEFSNRIGLNVSAGSSAINRFEYNKLWKWAQGDVKYANDMGGYYMWCDWRCPGNIFRYNYLNTFGHKGLYLDGVHSGSTFIGTVINGSGIPIEINGGHANTIDSALIVDAHTAGGINCPGTNAACKNGTYCWGTCDNMARFVAVLVYNNYQGDPWIKQFPWYKDFCTMTSYNEHSCDQVNAYPVGPSGNTLCAALPTGNYVKNLAFAFVDTKPRNISFSTTQGGFGCINKDFPGKVYNFTYAIAEFNKFGDQRNYEDVDPGFVNAKQGNYELRSDSIVYKDMPEFIHIPFDEIGRTKTSQTETKIELHAQVRGRFV